MNEFPDQKVLHIVQKSSQVQVFDLICFFYTCKCQKASWDFHLYKIHQYGLYSLLKIRLATCTTCSYCAQFDTLKNEFKPLILFLPCTIIQLWALFKRHGTDCVENENVIFPMKNYNIFCHSQIATKKGSWQSEKTYLIYRQKCMNVLFNRRAYTVSGPPEDLLALYEQ